MGERVSGGSCFPNELLPDPRLTGEEIRSLMRKYRMTIRQLAEEMGITRKRVRQVRQEGVKGYAFVWDWLEAISRGEITWREKDEE